MAMGYGSRYTYRGRRLRRGVANDLASRERPRTHPGGKPAVDGPAKPRAGDSADKQGQAKIEDYHA